MAVEIIVNKCINSKKNSDKNSKIALAIPEKDFYMGKNTVMLDAVSAKQRVRVPFRYLWLKFITGFFGLTLKKGVTR